KEMLSASPNLPFFWMKPFRTKPEKVSVNAFRGRKPLKRVLRNCYKPSEFRRVHNIGGVRYEKQKNKP
ncbi:MAG: hypothetical protein QW204_02200, partial [Thermoplasmata archaeon]